MRDASQSTVLPDATLTNPRYAFTTSPPPFSLRSLRHIASSPLSSLETSFPYHPGMLHFTMSPFVSHVVSCTPHHPTTDASSPLSFLETSLSQCPGMLDSTMSPFASHPVSCTRPRPLDDFTTTITSHFFLVPLCRTLCPLVIV